MADFTGIPYLPEPHANSFVSIIFPIVILSIIISSDITNAMLRKFSTNFRKGKKKENGQVNGFSALPEKSERRKSQHEKSQPVDHSAKREEVISTFEEFAQVLHAARRPLPSQTGDGTYLNKEEPSGLMADLKNLGFKDLKTLKEVIDGKAKGELVDDKTYLMERVIQVTYQTK